MRRKNKSRLFKFIRKGSLENSPMLDVITEKMVQEKSKYLIGRRLTEDELWVFVDEMLDADHELMWLTILSVSGTSIDGCDEVREVR